MKLVLQLVVLVYSTFGSYALGTIRVWSVVTGSRRSSTKGVLPLSRTDLLRCSTQYTRNNKKIGHTPSSDTSEVLLLFADTHPLGRIRSETSVGSQNLRVPGIREEAHAEGAYLS